MKFSYLVGKLAADKDSRKLSKIIGIRKLPRKSRLEKDGLEDVLMEHLIIEVYRLFKKDIGVPVDSEKILKVEGNFVWLNLPKEDFKEAIKESKEIINLPKGDLRENDQWKAEWGSFLSARDEH